MADLNLFVEDCGIYFERVGMSRMAGRIVGWLLVCDPPHQTQQDLVEALQASKSSISVAVRQLVQLYLVEQVALPGDRKDYFRVAHDIWIRSSRARLHQLTELRELSEEGLRLLGDAPASQRRRLEMMRDMNAFLESEYPKLLDRWDEIKKQKGYDDP
ncbi:MAG: MarR family transcriptional regulator [Chloroflexi bacterium]|nr:MarR family transcriptional regulator [Chloroflexota bacterium]